MYKDNCIAIVVPAYNEERLIVQTLEGIPDFVDFIVVVDDCSQDRTQELVLDRQEKDPGRVILIRHESNEGVGGAIANGYRWCKDNRIDAAVVMAGDAQMDPSDLPSLLDPIVNDEADFAKGNRLFTGDAWRKIPRIRYLGNSALSMLTKIASGYWHIADSQCGYTAINAQALSTIDWDGMYKRYGQPNDLLVRLNVYSFRVKDVPVQPVYDIGEESGINPIRIVPKLSWLLFKLFLWRMKEKYVIRDFHPLVFFYTLAFFLLIPGIIFGFYLLFYRLTVSRVAPTSALLAIFLLVSGLQALFFAMWFDMESNRDLKA